jgi:precorrin-6A/cobalt-precorrin-6A reductase
MKVLLLGGTGEARVLAQVLASEPQVTVVSSLAGRTAEARLPEGAVRHGGFGGVAGLVQWLRDNKPDVVVDATHPFAATMTAHAVAATRKIGLPLLVLRRPGWAESPGDDWHWVDSAEDAATVLPTIGARAFLTIGRQGLDEFAGVGIWMLARCVDPPEPRPTWCELILDRGPYELPAELELLRHHRIDVLVTKDSGGTMTSAKLVAARELGVPVVIVRRPGVPSGVATVEKVDQVVGWLRDRR